MNTAKAELEPNVDGVVQDLFRQDTHLRHLMGTYIFSTRSSIRRLRAGQRPIRTESIAQALRERCFGAYITVNVVGVIVPTQGPVLDPMTEHQTRIGDKANLGFRLLGLKYAMVGL